MRQFSTRGSLCDQPNTTLNLHQIRDEPKIPIKVPLILTNINSQTHMSKLQV